MAYNAGIRHDPTRTVVDEMNRAIAKSLRGEMAVHPIRGVDGCLSFEQERGAIVKSRRKIT
jgi:hypothetical protein